jgi:hypothetical protein
MIPNQIQTCAMTLKIVISSLLFILLVVTGIYLTRSGKPYHVLVFALHKVLTLALVILLFLLILPAIGQGMFPFFHLAVAVFVALGLIGLLVSGGMMSLDKYQGVMLWIHRVSVAAFLLCFLDLMLVLLKQSI